MKKDWMIVGAVALILSITALGGFYYTSAKPTFQRVCISSLKEQMRAPSTFRLIEQTFHAEPLEVDEASVEARIASVQAELEAIEGDESTAALVRSFDLNNIFRELLDQRRAADRVGRGGAPPHRFISFVEYEAANGFGVPLRNNAACEHNSWDNTFDDYSAFKLSVGSVELRCTGGTQCRPDQ